MLQENVVPPSEVGSSIVILTQTLGEEFSYCTLGLRPRVQYENSSPRVWVRITILLPPSEGGMYQTLILRRESQFELQIKGPYLIIKSSCSSIIL